ncbi:MAG: hypothetical protein WCF38_12880, partial [Pseudolabrys sp.]
MSEIIAWFDQHHVNLSAILTSAVVLVVVGLAISLLKRFLNNWLNSIQQRFQLSNATISTFIRVLTAAFWLIAVLSILDAWGIGIAGIVGFSRQLNSSDWGWLSCYLGNSQQFYFQFFSYNLETISSWRYSNSPSRKYIGSGNRSQPHVHGAAGPR